MKQRQTSGGIQEGSRKNMPKGWKHGMDQMEVKSKLQGKICVDTRPRRH